MAPIRRQSRAGRKTEELRDSLWPDLDKSLLWNRHSDDGFTPVPRTFPIVMAIIDDLTKGKPAGAVYFELWCRAYDEMYVSLGAAGSLATHAGYSGQRAVRMLHERIEQLDELGFIRTKEGSAGRYAHAVILNPHKVIRKLRESGHQGVSPEKYAALVERAAEIGATDFKDAPVAVGATPATILARQRYWPGNDTGPATILARQRYWKRNSETRMLITCRPRSATTLSSDLTLG